MPELLYALIAVIIGFVGLVWSADRFVEGSASIAKAAGLSPLLIGLTIVSLGTSAPEMMVSLNAALDGAGGLAIGNAIGSNLANIGLVLGVTAIIATLPVKKALLQHEIPMLAGVTLLAGWFIYDAHLTLLEGLLLAGAIIPVIGFLIVVKKKDNDFHEEDLHLVSPKKAWVLFLVGLTLLVISSKILVWGATKSATIFGVPPLIIGLTVVAVGTSLPELAASVVSALKGHHDIALGNVVGSNIFNLLAVMSIPSIIEPLDIDGPVFVRDYLSMAAITALLVLIIVFKYCFNKDKSKVGLGKLTGVLLLVCYAAYYVFLFQ